MRTKLIQIITTASLLLLPVLASAQKISVSGRITDTSGEPLPAVTVYETSNTTNGTISGADGNYQISVPSGGSITFSCLGYQDVTENVSGRAAINVTMSEEQLTLDAAEVVSVGYGTVARRDLTGSVSKVDMDQLLTAPVTSFDQALSGRVAGVVVTTSDGALGNEANITIRGNNSLTQSSSPLFIIDGFPSESSLAASLNPQTSLPSTSSRTPQPQPSTVPEARTV